MTNNTMNTVRLISNIEAVKATKQDAKSKEISIVVKTEDLENGVQSPVFYPSRWGMEYDTSDFRPINGGGNKLPEEHIEHYFKMLDVARIEYKKMLLKRNSGGGSDDGTIKELEKELKEKQARIDGQAAQIKILNEKLEKGGGGSAETDKIKQLEKMIETLASVQSKRIEIKVGNKAAKVIEKIVHYEFEYICELIGDKEAVYLYGPAGTGKSRIAEDIADALDLDFYPASTLTEEHQITGYRDAQGLYHDTNFRLALEKGGLYFIDEMDASTSEVLVALNSALASGYFYFPDGLIYAHENFRCIAAGNTVGRGATDEYSGRQALDFSTLDRFMAVEILYDERIDTAVANNDMELVAFAQAFRKAAEENEIMILLSYRGLGKIAKWAERHGIAKTIKNAVLKGLAADDVDMLARNMNIDSKNKYYKALKECA
jgi:hypothetical protein